MNKWVSIAISALTDFILTAGTGYVGAATAGAITVVPPMATIIVCCVLGLVQAARKAQAILNPPPP